MEETQSIASEGQQADIGAEADAGGGEEAYSLPPVFDLEATKQQAYEAAMAESDEGDDGDEQAAAASTPKTAAPAAPADPLSKLSPEEQEVVRARVAAEQQESHARIAELQAKANEQAAAERAIRERYDQWLSIDPTVQAEHDELKTLVYSSDPDKWSRLQEKGHDLETAIARVAELEGRIGERTERRALATALNRDAHETAWSALDQAIRAQTKHAGITNDVLEAGGDLTDLLDRAISAAVKTAVTKAEREAKGKLDEQKALYERRMTRAGGESSAVIEQGGRSGDPSTAFLASVMKNGRLVPGAIERAMRGDFESVPLGT